MAIRIPDNLMSRPNLPGGLNDGTENVTRQFGNRVEQAAGAPSVPNGMGGVANPAAGVEGEAFARAAETIARSAQNVTEYYNGLRTAEETSRSKLMGLEIEKADAELRSRLAADPEYARRTTAEQQQVYELERDTTIDGIRANYGFSQKAVIRGVDEMLARYKASSSLDYLEREVKPRVVQQQAINDAASDGLVIDKVAVAPTVENVAQATANIMERYDSPAAYATYGAQKAAQLKGAAIGKLQQTTVAGFMETLENSPLAKLSGPAIDTENLTEGPVAQLIGDEKARMKLLIAQLPIPESEKLVLQAKGEKHIEQFAKASVSDHNRIVKEQEQKRQDVIKDMADSWESTMSRLARNGGVTDKMLTSQLNKLAEHPDIKDDPQAQKLLDRARNRIDSERVAYERERRQIETSRRLQQTLTELRVENGIGISGSAADAMWKKNGTLKSFFDGGNALTPALVQEIDRMGAVPTSVLSSIQTDLRSGDTRVQQRGIANLRLIKGHSAKTQQALYRELPDEFAGVINRLEMGQTPQEALSFLTRPRPTPDVEKKLRTEAGKKEGLAAADSVLKDVDLDPKNMSFGLRDQYHEQWRDAYARSNGDLKLARDLFRQDISKNRKVGVSDFSGKVEQYPTSNFAPKETVTEIINRDIPGTKDKEVLPVFSGLIVVNGEEVPTYRVFIREDGALTEATRDGVPFYMTREEVAEVENAKRTKQLAEQTQRALENRAITDEAIETAGSDRYRLAPRLFEAPIRERVQRAKSEPERKANAERDRRESDAARRTIANRPNAARKKDD
jgi:hypothetical protein